jgi:hypothetical protein
MRQVKVSATYKALTFLPSFLVGCFLLHPSQLLLGNYLSRRHIGSQNPPPTMTSSTGRPPGFSAAAVPFAADF